MRCTEGRCRTIGQAVRLATGFAFLARMILSLRLTRKQPFHVMDEMIQEEENITVLLNVWISGVVFEENRIQALICESTKVF